MTGRDFDLNPYSSEEVRVVDFLQKIAPDIGGGDDPIGFFICSYQAMVDERKDRKRKSVILAREILELA